DRGRFLIACAVDGRPVGVVRGIRLRDGFPHEKLLAHHIRREEVASVYPDGLCTLNGLAVLPEYRSREYWVEDGDWKGNVATLLMLATIRSLENDGVKGALATTGGAIPTKLCHKLGFLVIDIPTKHPSVHNTLTMANIGIVFGSPVHLRAQRMIGMD